MTAMRQRLDDGPPQALELADADRQLRDGRALFSDAARVLLRGGVPVWMVLRAAAGVIGTLELIERKPELAARFARGEEVEPWRLGR